MGIFEQIEQGNNREFKLYTGVLGSYRLREAFGEKLTAEEIKHYQELEEAYRVREKNREDRFLEVWGNEVVRMHQWLTKRFGNPFTMAGHEDYKNWKIKSWLDNGDQSEGIYLLWRRGKYSLVFDSEDGYADKVIIKDHLSEEYIKQCIENWA